MKATSLIAATLFFTSLVLAKNPAFAESHATKSGAIIFIERCTLCHGNTGTGNGLLPLAIQNYPPTSLFDNTKKTSRTSIEQHLKKESRRNTHCPPWHHELSIKEITEVSEFAAYLLKYTDAAITLLDKIQSNANIEISANIGYAIYRTHCQICHGKQGEGDGQLSRIIENPTPYNLTLSQADDDYLFKIIKEGGERMNRSPSMPPWGGDLTDADIRSLIIQLKNFRTTQNRP